MAWFEAFEDAFEDAFDRAVDGARRGPRRGRSGLRFPFRGDRAVVVVRGLTRWERR